MREPKKNGVLMEHTCFFCKFDFSVELDARNPAYYCPNCGRKGTSIGKYVSVEPEYHLKRFDEWMSPAKEWVDLHDYIDRYYPEDIKAEAFERIENMFFEKADGDERPIGDFLYFHEDKDDKELMRLIHKILDTYIDKEKETN